MAETSNEYDQFGYLIFELESPLLPGDTMSMCFSQVVSSNGFDSNLSQSDVKRNGTFLNNDKFPSLGYCSQIELPAKATRKEYGLPDLQGCAERDHPFEQFNDRDGSDGYTTGFDIVVSTQRDQIAVAPGTLLKEWTEEGRRYFHYQAQEAVINFYAITSAKYAVLRRAWSADADGRKSTVDMEVYYHPSHHENIGRMMQGLDASLTYCSNAFGPYPYKSIKIAEVTREFDRAQSFPTMITQSEAMAFIMDVDSGTSLDIPFFITAHEVAHQWWGMQLVAGNVKGKNLLLESLAHYSAFMVYQKRFGPDETERLLMEELKRYQDGLKEALEPEVALVDVEQQSYLYYSKAGIQLFELQKLIGEESFNSILKSFLNEWGTSKVLCKQNRLANSVDLVSAIQAASPEDLQDQIHSIFFDSEPLKQ